MKFPLMLLILLLSGCAELLNNLQNNLHPFTAPTLAGTPSPGGRLNNRDLLNELEANGYQQARQGKITWVMFVDSFYKKSAELFPSYSDSYVVKTFRDYQRGLAEQMDSGKLTEEKWVQLIERKRLYLPDVRSAPILESAPRPRSTDSLQTQLADFERKGYQQARQGTISWLMLVDTFYAKRIELFPDSRDSNGINEIRLYQRVLAEQMDKGKITETEWAYMVESKKAEIDARNQVLNNTSPKHTNCTTTNVGSKNDPSFRTTCN